jgi:hypothetical protein
MKDEEFLPRSCADRWSAWSNTEAHGEENISYNNSVKLRGEFLLIIVPATIVVAEKKQRKYAQKRHKFVKKGQIS